MTEDQKKKMMERLKRLLALSRSANEHEAAAALAKAQEMMRELAITEDDLDLADYTTVESLIILIKPGHKLPIYGGMLANVVEKAFGCKAIFSDATVLWLGPNSKAQISAYSWSVLARLLKTRRAEYIFTAILQERNPGRRAAKADTYCEGWVHGVSKNIVEEKLSEKEKRLTTLFTSQKFPRLGTMEQRGSGLSASDSSDAWRDGIRDGQKTRLHAGVQADKKSQIRETRYLGAGS
ncbi:DUF2786 domain-containing protein [Acetobacter sp. TBRC 12305]|uniref:DUF2786 domain-containing protein n=1 Tax=Acetobacter garciniae TaxID=2817435 RepID=A0A939HPD1_9PROT|nr:DUF2786 domain-containing protein [Acetobacter garciniae]MBO1325282.1 DUF2786 domain-containing protein [Acetobacter garciniae]MBX0344746.1 DUF2786 domain-containing protein [Acetobacter garciniae]